VAGLRGEVFRPLPLRHDEAAPCSGEYMQHLPKWDGLHNTTSPWIRGFLVMKIIWDCGRRNKGIFGISGMEAGYCCDE
jgi:hypothetical protein